MGSISKQQPLSQRSNCCRPRKCIRWHIPVHAIFAVFYLFFLLVLSRPSFTSRTPNTTTFCSFKSHNPETFMSSAASAFVHATRKRSQKCLAQKVVRFGSPGWIPMIQAPFNSSCVALQYKTGTKFFHRAVPELHGIKNQKISVQPRGIFHMFSKLYRVCPRTNLKGQEKEYSLCTAKLLGRRHRHRDGRIPSL